MRKNPKTSFHFSLSIFAILIVAIGLFEWRAHSDPRSLPGHIQRWFRGESGPQQTVTDLVGDIRNDAALEKLQSWGEETLVRFKAGGVKTNGCSKNLLVPNVCLAREEQPEFIRHEWGETQEANGKTWPQVLVLFSTNNQPNAVAINWDSYGVAVGAPDYKLSFSPFLQEEAKPGVFVYHFYK
jgi:hypothetical protein